MVKAIIFDFWGTIMENGIYPSPFRQAKYFLRVKEPFSEFVVKFEKSLMLKKFENLYDAFKTVAKDFNLSPPEFVFDKMVGMWNKNKLLAKPYPEAIDVLKKLKEKKVKLALISDTDCFTISDLIEKYNLKEIFDCIVLSYEVGYLKTDPEMFDEVVKKLKVKKDQVIMVGDSIETDINGAKNAGIKPILVDRKGKREYEDKVADLSEIEKFL